MNAEATNRRPSRFDPRRLLALVRKETLQAVRDPSTILIAFVLPVILLFLFAFAVSLDVRDVRRVNYGSRARAAAEFQHRHVGAQVLLRDV